MNVFQTHADIVSDYATYIRSFLKIDDPAIRHTVEEALNQGKLWPEPLLQFNPSFEMYGSLEKLAQAGDIQRKFVLHSAGNRDFLGGEKPGDIGNFTRRCQ